MVLTPPRSLSPSALSAFTDCPLAFRFAYIDRLPQPPTVAASKGTLVHRALELLMTRAPQHRTIEHALFDLETAQTELADDPNFTGLTLDESAWEQFHNDARRLVMQYFQLEDPTAIRPIGLELKLQATIGGTRVRGIIDRLELDTDGNLVITDYKTGAVPRAQYEQAKLTGVQLYAMLCERVFGARPARVQLLYLSQPAAIVAAPTDQRLRGVEAKTGAVWTAVERACSRDDFRPKPGKLCSWCAFRSMCPAMADTAAGLPTTSAS
ncbi:MAG: RecB family exonuclease [Acidimicrobiia bacterium]